MTVIFDTIIEHVALEDLHPSEHNPRRDLGDLTDMAASIAALGVIEPLIVTERDPDGYTVIAGHRRLAAAQLAGLDRVPCVIRSYTRAEAIEVAIVENLQRSDLTPLDEARAFQMLVDLGGSQRDVAERVGCSQSHISRRLSLIKLPDVGAELLRTGKLTIRQAEQLAEVPDDDIDTVAKNLAGTAERYTDSELPAWAMQDAIDRAVRQRKNAAAVAAGEASGLKRLTKDPRWDGTHEKCKKGEATHWYVAASDQSVVWARTKKAAAKARGDAPASPTASTPPGPSIWEIERQAENRIGDAINELATRTRTDATIADAFIAAGWKILAGTLRARGGFLDYSWGSGAEELHDLPDELLATIGAVRCAWSSDWTVEPEYMLTLQLLVDHGYRPGDGETIPDGFEVPTDAAGIALTEETSIDSEPSAAKSEALPPVPYTDGDYSPPTAPAAIDDFYDPAADPQAQWELAHPDAATKPPWGTYKQSTLDKLVNLTRRLESIDKLRHTVTFERANGDRDDIITAATSRLDELTGAVDA